MQQLTQPWHVALRPQTFDDPLFAPTVDRKAIAIALKDPAVQRAWLLHGPPGCAKTTTARIIARQWGGPDATIREANASDDRGIDFIRKLTEDSQIRSGTKRVWILDEAHNLTKDAQSAALKLFEEPPASTMYILCTTDPHKLSPAIQSRMRLVQVYALNKQASVGFAKAALAHLRTSLKVEVPELAPSAVMTVLTAAGGSPRKILTGLQALASGQAPEAICLDKVGELEIPALAKALRQGTWDDVAMLIGKAKASETVQPESIRIGLCGYLLSAALGKAWEKPDWKASHSVAAMLGHLKEPCFTPDPWTVLVANLYRAWQERK